MAEGKIFPITTQPGIKRDGSQFSGNYYTDGQWCRFQRGLPRKMGGYQQMTGNLTRIPYGIYVTPKTPNFQAYIGDSNTLQYLPFNENGMAIGPLVDRTPATLGVNPFNIWQFDQMFVRGNNDTNIIAHAAPNLSSISNTTETPVFYGKLSDDLPFIPTPFNVSGGISVFHPYLFMFGNFGEVIISNINDPTTEFDRARISSQKIVAGLPVRGGNSSPSGLLWTLDSLVRATYLPNLDEFRFDTVSNQSSCLSSRSMVEYDGIFFWAGVDRFLMYTGIVREVPNQMNLDYFYKNLNYAQRQKVWATKVPEYGEIWWFYPTIGSNECNKAVIFNVRENTWYDTDISRSSGYFEQVFANPIWASNTLDAGFYSVWEHEVQNSYDKNVGGVLTSIPSHFETSNVALPAAGPTAQWTGIDHLVDLERVEPDFWQQNGNLSLTVRGRAYANSPVVDSAPYIFDNTTLKIDMREQRREMTLKFESDSVGGFYELGQTLLYFKVGDVRP